MLSTIAAILFGIGFELLLIFYIIRLEKRMNKLSDRYDILYRCVLGHIYKEENGGK